MTLSRFVSGSEKLTLWILRWRYVFVIAIVIVSVACVFRLPRLEFSGDIGAYVDGSDADLQDFLDDTATFGSYETFILVIEADDVLSADVLQVVENLSDIIGDDLDVERVVSLTRLPFGLVERQELETLSADEKRGLLENPYLSNLLLAPDGTRTLILAIGDALELDARDRLALAGRLKGYAAAGESDAVTVHVTGPSTIALDAVDVVKAEFARFIWLAPVLLGAAIFFVFRGHPAVAAPIIVAGLALVWTLGLFVATGNQMSMLLTMMPVVVSIVTFADGVHILHKYFTELQSTDDRLVAIRRTMGVMYGACLMTSVTTALGFLALYGASTIAAVRVFALWTAIGVLIAFLLVIVIVPISLLLLPVPTGRVRESYWNQGTARLITRLCRFSRRGQVATPYIVGLLLVLFAWGSTRLDVRTDVTQLLPRDLPSIQTLNGLHEAGQMRTNLDFVISMPGQSLSEENRLADLYALENALLEHVPEAGSIQSITRVIESLHEQEGHRGFPTDPADLDEYLLFVELTADEHWLRGFVSEDFESVRFSVRIDHENTRSAIATINRIEQWLNARVPDGWSVRTSGAMKLFTINMQALVDSQLRSFLIAALVITMTIFLFIRHVRLSGISLIVNLFPVLLTMGIFPILALASSGAITNASLNVATIMVPSVAMALAVDDTIHFLAYYRAGRAAGATVDEAISRALHGAGFAILVTTVTMILGFSVLFFSSMPTNREFAVLLSFALVAAVVADLVVLPHFIRRWVRDHDG